MKKKWQKPTRREVRAAVQFSLMEITSTIGFSTVYLILLLILSGCSTATVQTEGDPGSSMFVKIEETDSWIVVYHKETKFMYAVSYGLSNVGTFTLLVNPDGTPMTWKE